MGLFAFKSMPKTRDELINQLLADTEFHPGKPEAERQALASAFFPENVNYFTASDDSPSFNLIRGADGKATMLLFKNATLARAETNANNDNIDDDGVKELAATIAGCPIDVEHHPTKIPGMFTAGRVGKQNNVLVDGAIWADRFPEEADKVMNGIYSLSVEATAETARCSICDQVFASADKYCDHLINRRATGAVRRLKGLKSKGGAITRKPAGSNTAFDQNQLYIIASHMDPSMMDDHTDVPPPQGEAKDPQKEMQMEEELNKAKAELQAALAKITDLEAKSAEKDGLLAKKDEAITALEASNKGLIVVARRAKLGKAIDDAEWEKIKEVLAALPEAAFELMASKMVAPAAPPPNDTPPLTVPANGQVSVTLR